MEFRQEKFLTFIRITKLPFIFVWPFNLGFFILLLIVIIQTINLNLGSLLVGVSFISLAFIGMKGFIYGMNYKMYSRGGEAIRELSDSKYIILNEVKVYIKGFDLFSVKKIFPPNINKTIYDFNNSDLVLTEKSIILMGKGFGLGFIGFAYPVELIFDAGMTSLPKARIIQWTEKNSRIEIQFEDPNYSKGIKIEMKNEIDTIKQWLTKVSVAHPHKIR